MRVAIWDECCEFWQWWDWEIAPGTPDEQIVEINEYLAGAIDEPWGIQSISPRDLGAEPVVEGEPTSAECPVQGKVWVGRVRSDPEGFLGVTIWPRGQ